MLICMATKCIQDPCPLIQTSSHADTLAWQLAHLHTCCRSVEATQMPSWLSLPA